MESVATFIEDLKEAEAKLQEVLVYKRYDNVELISEERSVNTSAINFMHALSEFGRHVGTFIYRSHNGSREALKVKRGIVQATDTVSYNYIRALYPHIDNIAWLAKPWLSESLQVKEGIYAMVILMASNARFSYECTSVEAVIVRSLMASVCNAYFGMVREWNIGVPPKELCVEVGTWITNGECQRLDYKAVLKRQVVHEPLYQALLRAADYCHMSG